MTLQTQVQAPSPRPRVAARPTFGDYLRTRRYRPGRSSRDGWDFVIHALGDAALPEITTWRALAAYLADSGAEPHLERGALSVWRSYTVFASQYGRGGGAGMLRRAGTPG